MGIQEKYSYRKRVETMDRLPELIAAYAAMSPRTRELLRDFAKGLSERMPDAERAVIRKARKPSPSRSTTSRA